MSNGQRCPAVWRSALTPPSWSSILRGYSTPVGLSDSECGGTAPLRNAHYHFPVDAAWHSRILESRSIPPWENRSSQYNSWLFNTLLRSISVLNCNSWRNVSFCR
jgi:hypothetical protein